MQYELTDHEAALIAFHRMTPAAQAAERKRLQDAAYEAALARLTPERRIIAEQRKADSLAAIAAEKTRLTGMTRDGRETERALKQKKAAETTIAKLPQEVVDKVTADLAEMEV